NVVNVKDVAPRDEGKGKLGFRARRLGPEVGGRSLGCHYFEVAPGKTAFPFHFHSAIEEAIYVLEGRGTVRIGEERVAIGPGDYVASPPGPTATHALTNDGDAPLRYLCMSAPATPATLDVVAYPDSKKVAYVAGFDPVKGFRAGAWLMKILKDDGQS